MTAVTDRQKLSYIAAQAADARVNVELETEGMTLNIGPQHPATHGTLRIVAQLDGEQVIRAEPMAGYMHRGYEKLSEVRTYPQVTTLVNRIDWLGSFANEVPFILAAEQLMEVEAPPRARWIRTMLFEMSRIANLILFLGDMGVQLGAVTPVFFAFRDREFVLDQIEKATGGRFHPNFDRIGGLKDDVPEGWIESTRSSMDKVRSFCDEMEDLLLGSEIFQARTRGIGVIPKDVAMQYGMSGANARGSGIDWDLRRDNCVGLAYDELDWKVWTHPDGDSFARFWIRLQEVREAAKMIEQLCDGLPSGPIMAKVPRIIKVPAGEAYVATENPLGEMGYYLISQGGLTPFRLKIRSASFNNVSITPWLLRGVYVPDIITILGSIYFILGDIDPMTQVFALELAYWQETIVRVLFGLVAVLALTGGVVYLYLFKFVSFMQSRLGPMEAGPYGSLQLLAEVGKWLQKEDIAPQRADKFVFGIAPAVVLTSTFLIFVVIPAGPNAVIADLATGIYYVLGVSSLSVIGILMAGWASANKYALIGGLRAAGQLIAYELPLVLAVVGVVITVGSLNLQDIVAAQASGDIFGFTGIGNPFIITQFIGFMIFLIAVQAELTQTPFDMPIAESELVAGYHVEYTGIRFLVYFISEFATAVAFAAVASTLFLGGWAVPESWGVSRDAMHWIGPLVISTKAILLVGVVFWVRFTFPRFREDQLQALAWKGLIPLALANIALTAVFKVVF